MKKTFLIFTLLVPVLLAACSGGRTFYNRLHRTMRDVPAGDTVLIRMADLFSKPWDTMYVFRPMSHYPGLEHYQNYPDYHDIGRRIVFVKDGTVVFLDDEIAVEWPYSVELYSDSLYFTPETAVFLTTKYIRRNEWDRRERTYYVLRPLIGTRWSTLARRHGDCAAI